MFDRVGEGAGHDGGTLAADIGQPVAFVQAGICQKPVVAGVAAKRTFSQGLGRAALFNVGCSMFIRPSFVIEALPLPLRPYANTPPLPA